MAKLKETKSDDITRNSNFNVFCSKAILSSQSNNFGYIYNENYFIPYYIKEKLIFRSIIFTSDAVSLKKNQNSESKKKFLNTLIIETKELLKVDFIACPPSFVLFESAPNKSINCAFGSYKMNLKKNESELFKNLHSKHRNVIRKSIKDGIEIHFGKKYFKQCYDVIFQTHKRQNIFFPSFDEMKKFFNSPNFNIICAVSLKNNIIQGGALIPWNKNCGYYLYGGSINKPHAGSMNHLQWEIILKLKHLEVSQYDFVGARLNPKKGSKLEGIQRFKSRFGSELNTGYLWKYDYNKFKKLLYTTLIFLKSRKFPKDIVDEEN